ncbi:MBG domain-containing protein [Terriglobus aquaticus]|uniref:MBG domain-containing protein n=1 Tax=Terriglobus aquaticus TaxID=940139 RepID=A0ABW9KG95_9BACT|nr:MBG domain-containing protein [Terriglobus aquaticus]
METLVSPFASPANHPPVAVSPAIVTVPIQSLATFTIFATDQDNDTIHYRLATPQEQFDETATNCSTQSPPGLTISNSGVGTWDTSRITAAGCNYPAPVAGQIWPVQFMIEDLDSNGQVKSKVPVDVLLKFVNVTQPAPTLTFSTPTTVVASPGNPLTFTATAINTTPGSRITLNAVGLPTGATATNINQTLTQPVSSVFSWTPTLAQEGTYVIVYTATNDTYEQTVGSVSVKVLSSQPPSLTCSTGLTAQYNALASFPLTVLDPQGDAVTVTWSVDGNVSHTDTVAASSNATTLSLNQAFTTLGAHTVSVSATNTDNQTSTCSTPVTVTTADQTIAFGALPNLTYGDAGINLAATATSNLPISYVATGACSVSGNTLSVQGVGTCSVTANQAGDASYNPATSVTQTTSIAPRALHVTAANATRVYGSANPTLTGNVTGTVNGDVITATYSTSANATSPVGTYPITPALAGTNLSNYSVVANNATLMVTQATITVSANNVTRNYGTSNPTLTGTVSGVVNGDQITATYSTPATVSSPVGTYPITPALTGPALSNYNVVTNNGSLTINKGVIAGVQITSSAPTVFLQTRLTFQAAVTGTGGTPTGSISFVDGTTPLGSAQLVNGIAQLTYSDLTTGSHQITAVYSGDSNYIGAASAPISQQIADVDLRLQLNAAGSTTQTVMPGGSTTVGFTVAPLGMSAFPSDVALSVTGLPPGATYTTSTTNVTKGSSATQVTLTIKVPAATASVRSNEVGGKVTAIAVALIVLPFSAAMRRRARSLGRLTAMLLLVLGSATVLLGLTGCGTSNGFLAQPEKSYTVTVTASTAAVSRSTTMQLIVQ